MDAKTVKHNFLRSKWTPIVTECKNSGMTVRAWCLENNVDEKQFYYWQRKIREELYPAIIERTAIDLAPTFISIPKEVLDSRSEKNGFCPDMVINCGKIKVEISNSVSPRLLSELLKVIHHA